MTKPKRDGGAKAPKKASVLHKHAAPKVKAEPKTKRATRGQVRSKLDAIGIEEVCEKIEADNSLAEIARGYGISGNALTSWLDADPERSARARASRERAARTCDDEALNAINALNAASSTAEVAKARELAHHYRWRASKRNPREYGDKLDLNHSGKVELTDDQVTARLATLLGKANAGAAGQS